MTDWEKSFELENGLVIDEAVYLGNDGGEGVIIDDEVKTLYFKELPFTFQEIPLDREVLIPEGHQLLNYNGMTINGDLAIKGNLVLI